MEKWECVVCGYVYDVGLGDPARDVNPSTRFEKLPKDWTCPECGAGKDEFERLEE